VSRQDGTKEGVVDVLRTTELRESEPEHDDRLEKVIECYRSAISTYPHEPEGEESYAASTGLSLTNTR
jgi:hypothetical protein